MLGCRLVSKLLLKGLGKALSLGWVSNSGDVDAREVLSLDMVDLTWLQSHLAANEGVIRVTVCSVVASRVKDALQHQLHHWRVCYFL